MADGIATLKLTESQEGVLLSLRVKPRARANCVEGVRNRVLVVCVQDAPADGKANAAVLETVARVLGCAKSTLSLTRGHKSRDKTVCVSNLCAEEVRKRLSQFS